MERTIKMSFLLFSVNCNTVITDISMDEDDYYSILFKLLTSIKELKILQSY